MLSTGIPPFTCLDPLALQAASMLMAINVKEASSRHIAAANTSALYNLLKKESIPAVALTEGSETRTEAFAWQLRMAADRIQRKISDGLGIHCSSFRDAKVSLQKATTVESELGKFLTQLNAAETLLKHCDGTQVASMEEAVQKTLDNHSRNNAYACGKVTMDAQSEDINNSWNTNAWHQDNFMDGSTIFLGSLIGAPADTTDICPAPLDPKSNHTSVCSFPSVAFALEREKRETRDELLFDPWAGKQLGRGITAACANSTQECNSAWSYYIETSSKEFENSHATFSDIRGAR